VTDVLATTPPTDAAPATPSALALREVGLLAPLYPLPRLELVSGKGARVVDSAGASYLDFTAGIAVSALGHAPPGLARAIAKQAKTMIHCSNLFANPPAAGLAAALIEATGYDRVFFCNSGTEGIDAALKFARARAHAAGHEGRDILAFKGGFHGRTGFALSATWNPPYREPFQPLIPGVRFAEFNDIAGLDDVLDADVAAVVVEPVQGESGAVPARQEFLHALRVRTAALGATLIFDEVQIGMGRSGRLLAAEHYGVRADVTVLSKALGGGVPIAAVLMSADVAGALAPGMHGCTFGGGPLAAAAAAHVLATVRQPAFLARVRSRAYRLERGLATLAARHASVREARGLGLLRAIDLAPDASYDAPALVRAARAQGLLLVRGGERAVRVLPPLVVSNAEIDEGLEKLEAAIASLEAEPADTQDPEAASAAANPPGGEAR
jgi:acetylornithine/N-succinyldiaminopimelate aminotransferase